MSSLGIEKAWGASHEGAGVRVAVLDSGVQGSHPDLRGVVTGGTDLSGKGSANGQQPIASADEPQHATAMAGFVAGRGHGAGNKLGLLGVAPRASVLSVSLAGYDRDVAQGIRWAVDHGAKVINMSFSGGGSTEGLTAQAIAYAQAHDVVLVGAVGNSGNVGSGWGSGVVTVAGVDKSGTRDPASDYGGPSANAGEPRDTKNVEAGVTVAAPFSTGPQGEPGMPSLTLTSKGSYTDTFGNSNGTAIVSGIAALIRAAHPSMNAANVVQRLIYTATPPKGLKPGYYSDYYGYGTVNAYAAVTGRVPSVCEPPVGSQATGSIGVWGAILAKKPYKPTCDGQSSSPSSPSSSPSSSADSSAPASSANSSGGSGSSAPPAASSTDSSGIPPWVWIVIAVVVLGALAVVLLLRRRAAPAHGGQPPPGPWTGPPPNGPPPGYGPPPGPPPGGPGYRPP